MWELQQQGGGAYYNMGAYLKEGLLREGALIGTRVLSQIFKVISNAAL